MSRFAAAALAVVIFSGCGNAAPAALPTGAPSVAAPVAASVAPSVAPSVTAPATPAVTPTAAATRRPTPSVSPTPFPVAAFAALSDKPVPEDVAADLQAALEATEYGAGLAATVITPDGMWSGAFGKADGAQDVAVDAQFGIGSGTKPIIAAQVMLMVEAGEISLDRPATEYLPADFDFDTNGATIRQLLSHRSGIPDWYEGMKERFAEDRSRVWTLEEMLALVPATRRPAGGAEHYADTNYNLLGLVIEHVRQRPLVKVLRDGALRVEGTDRLIWQPDEKPTDPMAMPLGESRDALEQGRGYLPSISDTVDGAAGGMASDSISLARWWRAFCSGEIVSQASLTEMSTLINNEYGLGLLNPAAGYAQGVGHLGANFGYNSWSGCMTDDQLIVVVLINRAETDIFNLGRPLVLAARSE